MTGSGGLDAQVARVDADPVVVQRAPEAVRIDGRLDDRAWIEAVPIPLSFEIEPGQNAPAAVATDCRLTYDDQHLYFGCEAEADPRRVRAFLVDRDELNGQDRIGIMIDPFRDRRRAFAFAVSALGVQEDFVFGQGESNAAWDAIWQSEGRMTAVGYVVEAAIPFKSLRFPATSDVQSWNIFFWRTWPRSEAVSLRSVPLDRSNQCALCQLGTVTGLHGIAPGRNVEIAPSFTARRSDARDAVTEPALGQGSIADDYGVNARWGITPDLSLNATLNPDFSQVAADDIQLQDNQQFALFFEERRPFFLEGADFFRTPLQAVFTRSIADPSAGAKISGKVGGWAVGGLLARDERTNVLLPGPLASSSTSLDREAITGIVRIRRDVGGSGTVGGLLTVREAPEYRNRVAGVDARIQLTGPLTLSGQLLRSTTRDAPEVRELAGLASATRADEAAYVRLDFGTRNWFGWAFLEHFGRDFRADAGFMPTTDIQGYAWRVQRHWWLDGHPVVTRFSLLGGSGARRQVDGSPLMSFVFADLNLRGVGQSEVVLNPDYFERWWEGRRFHLSRLNVFGSVYPTARLEAGWFLQFGEELDFVNARASGLTRVGPWVDLRVGSNLDVQLDYTYKRLVNDGSPVFREQIASARLVYYLSRRLFVRGIVQARDLTRDPEQYREPVSTGALTVASQLLLSYKLNPESVAFVGYSGDSLDLRENLDPRLGLVRMRRTFFVKLSYAWRP